MIASVRGIVEATTGDSVVVDVSGVGYLVAVTPDVAAAATVGREIRLHTALIVREDGMSLVGFPDRDRLRVFTALTGVSGVGPRSALGVLAVLTIDEIAGAVAGEDDAPFRRVPGIGPKTAKLIVVQLAGRLDVPVPPPGGAVPASTVTTDAAAQVVAALVGLGWPERTAAETVTAVRANAPDADDAVPALLRRALSVLGPSRGGSDA